MFQKCAELVHDVHYQGDSTIVRSPGNECAVWLHARYLSHLQYITEIMF